MDKTGSQKQLRKFCRTFALILAAFFINACYYDKYDEVYPGTNLMVKCDSTGSYSKAVSRVFVLNCNGCHNQNVNNGGVILDNYNGARTAANSGKLMPAIAGPNHSMPPGSKLDSCSIKAIGNWIKLGTPNN